MPTWRAQHPIVGVGLHVGTPPRAEGHRTVGVDLDVRVTTLDLALAGTIAIGILWVVLGRSRAGSARGAGGGAGHSAAAQPSAPDEPAIEENRAPALGGATPIVDMGGAAVRDLRSPVHRAMRQGPDAQHNAD